MIKQFEISASVQKQIGDYLAANNTDLKTAMADETRNGEVAAIIHAGLPMMVRKIYSLEKMKNFFWTKKRADGRIRRHAPCHRRKEKTLISSFRKKYIKRSADSHLKCNFP